jgi:hypothetical protein
MSRVAGAALTEPLMLDNLYIKLKVPDERWVPGPMSMYRGFTVYADSRIFDPAASKNLVWLELPGSIFALVWMETRYLVRATPPHTSSVCYRRCKSRILRTIMGWRVRWARSRT